MKDLASAPRAAADPGRDRFPRRVVAGAAAISLAVTLLVAFTLYNGRRHADRLAEIWTQNTSRILENNLLGIFDKIGIVLAETARETRREMAAGGIRPRELDGFLREQIQGVPELYGLAVADADGQIHHGTNLAPGRSVPVADRDYFRRLQECPDGAVVVSPLIQSRVSGRWSITLARRLNGPDGQFGGAAIGIFEVGSFERLFSNLDIGRRGAVGVRDQDSRLVALYPKGEEPGSQIGSDLVSDKTRALIQAHSVTATYKVTVARDHTERMVSFRQVAGYPYYIFATRSPSDYLAPWYQEAAISLSLLVVFILATAVLARTLLKGRATEQARSEAVRVGEAWRLQNEELNAALSRVRRLEGTIPICAYCKKIRTEEESWEQLEKYFTENSDATFSHGACPDCAKEQMRLYKGEG